MSNTKMNKDIVPENFTLSLVLVDALPVLFFSGSVLLISILFHSALFFLGAMLCIWAGLAKVIWKLIVVLRKKNVWWLFMQMRIVMPIGFVLILLAVILGRSRISFAGVAAGFLSVPSVFFFVAGIIGMCLMGFFAARLDSSDVRANWTEQFTNGMAQGAIFVGLLLLVMR